MDDMQFFHFPHAVGTESVLLHQNFPKHDIQPVKEGTRMKKPVMKKQKTLEVSMHGNNYRALVITYLT